MITNEHHSQPFAISKGISRVAMCLPHYCFILLWSYSILLGHNDRRKSSQIALYAASMLFLEDSDHIVPKPMNFNSKFRNLWGYKINWEKSIAMPINYVSFNPLALHWPLKWATQQSKYLELLLINVRYIVIN